MHNKLIKASQIRKIFKERDSKPETLLTVVTLYDGLNQSESGLVVDLALCALHAVNIVIGEFTSRFVVIRPTERHCLILFVALHDAL